MLDKLKNDPASLTSAEEAMRKTNPVTLAVLKLASVTIDPSKMSPEEQQIAQMDPFLYGALQKANVDISGGVGFPTITIDGKLLEMTPETRRVLEQAYRDDGVVGLALRQLGLVKSDPTIDGLLPATSAPRLTYTTQQVALLMSQGKDIEAMAVLNANMNGALSPAEREKLLADAGLPYFGPGTNYWNQQIDKALAGPGDTSQSRIGDWDADKVGRWMQEVAKNAPPELVNMMLDAVKAKYSPDWIAGNGTAGAMSYSGVDWCKGLSLSVSVADQIPGKKRTEEFAKWIAGVDPEHNLLNNISFGGYNAMRASIEDGYSSGLWRAIVAEYQNNSGAYSEAQVHIQTRDIPGVIGDAEGRVQAPAARAAYNNFNANKDKILQTFFDQFLDDPKIGVPVSTQDTPELRDMVGIVLDFDPNINLDRAAAHDDSVDWYDPKSYEGQVISVVVAWILDQSKTADGQRDDGAKVAGVPFVYSSGIEGVHNGGLFKITRSDGSDEFIDGTAALDAVGMSGGERVDPTDVNFKWHFDSIQQFQDDNYYDNDGDIYLPVNFRLTDFDGDDHVEREDYERINAANTTWF